LSTWDNWHSGQRCVYCINNNIKKTIEEIKIEFKKEGYILLSKEYKNNKNLLKVRCPQGHEYYTKYNYFKSGCRCPYCSGNIKKTIEEVREAFEKEGYTLLSTEYKSNKDLLDVRCPKGHEYRVRWDNFQRGYRCKQCKTKYYSKEDLEKYFGYKKSVRSLTNRIYKKYRNYINPNKYRRGKNYHLDHIYSIVDGFENNVPVDITSNPHNLRMVPAKENLNKNGKSYISKMLLYHLAI